MQGNKIGIVYDKDTSVVLRTIISDGPNDDALLDAGWPFLQPHESVDVIARSEVNRPTVENVCAKVNELKGKALKVAPRCVVLDAEDKVVDVIVADPAKHVVTELSAETVAKITAYKETVKVVEKDYNIVPVAPYRVVEALDASLGDKVTDGVVEKKVVAKPDIVKDTDIIIKP